MEFETLQYEKSKDGKVATIWLNRPEVLNAINTTLARERVEAFTMAAEDDDVRAIVLRGRGRAFCAGRDLRQLSGDVGKEPGSEGAGLGDMGESWKLVRDAGLIALNNDWLIPKPTIAVVHGYAVAGGFEMMMWCDLAIVTNEAKIGDYHLNRGLLGGAGPYWSVPRSIGMRKAKELFWSGKLLSGQEAVDYGLANLSVPEAELDAAVDEYVAQFTNKSPLALAWCKLALSRSLESDRETIAVLEHFMVMGNHQTKDAKEGATAFLEGREPVWEGR
jgi:enoyl-CoA hydratase